MDCGHNATDVRSQQHFGFVVVADDGFCTALLRALACGESVGASQTQGGDGPRGQKVSSNGTKGCHYVVGSCAGTNPKGCRCHKEDEQRGDRVHPALQVPAGGSPGKDWILRELTENKLAANAGVKEILNTLRTRRRNLGKASEFGVQLPDPLLLMGLLSKWSDSLCRVGGSQMAFRVAGMRQALALDTTPLPASVTEFAEHLQAEAEQLMLATPTATSTVSTPSSTVAADVKKKELVKAAALTTPNEKARCRFWGTAVGCKRADSCSFEHSWDGIQKKGRCWNCSAEGHLRPDCPYPRDSSSSQLQRKRSRRSRRRRRM